MWAELAPVGRSADSGGYRRYRLDRDRSAACGSGSPTRRSGGAGSGAGSGRQPVGLVGRSGRRGAGRPAGRGDRQPPGLGAGRRCLRRPARRGVGLRRAGRAAGAGFSPSRPIGVVNFGDEEGARFGIACAGSRLITGALAADRAAALTDGDGQSMAEAMAAAGFDPGQLGADRETLDRIGCSSNCTSNRVAAWSISSQPVAVGSAIWPHGRWRIDLPGEANHAGTTRLADRRRPDARLCPAGPGRPAGRRTASVAGHHRQGFGTFRTG